MILQLHTSFIRTFVKMTHVKIAKLLLFAENLILGGSIWSQIKILMQYSKISENKNYCDSVLNYFGPVSFVYYNFCFDLVPGRRGRKFRFSLSIFILLDTNFPKMCFKILGLICQIKSTSFIQKVKFLF